MKKVKVEEYKKPTYSTLRMVTGKILPAGLVIATMVTSVPNAAAQATATPAPGDSINEIEKSPGIIAGGVPYPTLEETEKKPITVTINGKAVEFDVAPVLENGRVLVPLRKIFEELGATVTWEDETKTATAIKGDDSIVIAADNETMDKNGRKILLDVAAKIVDDRLLVPIRAVSKGLGCNVVWDEINNQIIIAEKKQNIVVSGGAAGVVKN